MPPIFARLLPAILTVATLASAQPRTTYNFNPDWHFLRADQAGAEQAGFDDSAWAKVGLPHTWNDIDTFDNFAPGGHTGEAEMWTGVAWYRKTFTLPPAAAGHTVILEFEGVRQIADVFVNGQAVAHNETGFIAFGADLTPHVKPGANVIAVKVDNRFDRHFEGDRPWNHPNWHPSHGGIYRDVRLHVLDPVHVTLPLYSDLGTEGVYVWTKALTPALADVALTAELENRSDKSVNAELALRLIDADGGTAATGRATAALAAGARTKVPAQLALPDPRLWEPAYPHVYQLELSVRVDGTLRDRATVPYAPRSFAWDRDTGFWLNGRNLKLHGWGTKPTGAWAGLGAAIPDWLRDYTMRQMADAGGNFLRWGHCAGSGTEQHYADRYGFVTLMPGVDGERDCDGQAWATRKAAFRDAIIYFRNHPSVMAWEGGNYNISPAHTAELRQVFDQWDPNGGRYFGFRMATPAMLPWIDLEVGTIGRRRALPMLPVVEAEYDRTEAPRRLWDQYSPPDFGRMGANEEKNTYRSTQETFAVGAVEEWWTKFAAQPAHSGGANWVFHDEPHGSRQVTDTARATGEVDGVRLPKEAYYVLQTMWRDRPQVHLIGHWNYPAGTVKTVYAVGSRTESSAELSVNGRSLGLGQLTHGHLFLWANVKFEPGTIKVVTLDAAGRVVAEQEKQTAGAPAALRITPITAPGGWRADAQDVALFDVEIVDARGRRCPTVQQRVDFAVTGPGVWRGGYNSGRERSTNHLWLDVECGINRVSIRSTREAGAVRLVARTAGLPEASAEVVSSAFATEQGLTRVAPASYAKSLAPRPAAPAAESLVAQARLRQGPRAAVPAAPASDQLFSSYAYTGEGAGEPEAPIDSSTLAFTDDALNYLDELPAYLHDPGTRILRTALKDASYWANDYIVGAAARDLTIFVALDPRSPAPGWVRDWKTLPEPVVVSGKKLKLYTRAIAAHEVLRISGAADQGRFNNGTLNLLLFAQPR